MRNGRLAAHLFLLRLNGACGLSAAVVWCAGLPAAVAKGFFIGAPTRAMICVAGAKAGWPR